MASRMSSREIGSQDVTRAPQAVLRNRILARSRLPVLVVTLAIAYGTVGYWLVEGRNLLDACYETMLTLSTLGVATGPPPGTGGKIFTISLILFGVVIPGDPADETVLRQAGIERARGLICAVDSDAANVFITLTARALNPDLRIVARASDRASIDKLVRAGADEVVSPYGLTGRRMAILAVQPSVLEVLDLLNLGSDIRLEEVAVRAGTHLDSLTIAEARARYAGVAILALKKPGSDVSANPDHELRLIPGDLIVALGPAEILNRMAS